MKVMVEVEEELVQWLETHRNEPTIEKEIVEIVRCWKVMAEEDDSTERKRIFKQEKM